jgi:hypothetical protein
MFGLRCKLGCGSELFGSEDDELIYESVTYYAAGFFTSRVRALESSSVRDNMSKHFINRRWT